MARRYGCLPSELVGMKNPFAALTLNVRCADRGIREDNRAFERERRRRARHA